LAPSARAAAELAHATGQRTDTLAKWLHDRSDPRGPGTGAANRSAWTRLDDRTVLMVDEASMASTLDLDLLINVAGAHATKVVLVGDPAQIGVINGPGGMLATLHQGGHGIELATIHRFTHEWERRASVALRDGNPEVLATYQAAGRLHPCPDAEQGLDEVFTRWAAARADGRDALMMARTRTDVDALNTRARNAAHPGEAVGVTGVRIGERDWAAGDLLRARRNDRRLTIGDTHVRNGDRFRVLGAGPTGGLVVEDLGGRGRLELPAAYVARHADYGWAATIDAAQGATTDIGVVLVRPGLDREHLYVAMTRGREENHAYITPDRTTDPEHHGPRAPESADRLPPVEAALDILAAALANSGAQDSAHTAREAARARAEEQARADARTADVNAADVNGAGVHAEAARTSRRTRAVEIPQDHLDTSARLADGQARMGQLRESEHGIREQLHAAQAELEQLPRWSRGRRRDLVATLAGHRSAMGAIFDERVGLNSEIEVLSRLERQQTRARAVPAAREDSYEPAERLRASLTRSTGRLAWPRPVELAPPSAQADQYRARHHARDAYTFRDRDDDLGLGR
ncbi:AAA family ATPase, partial [Sporichthya sp.]|uniref:AAA family ATPase n=1 Tax=Sporichthya sp. TaxID=65475 RepID=UPI00185D507A